MKRVAIPVLNNELSSHFGQTEYFYIFDIEGNEVKKQTAHPAPPHTHGSIPTFLKELNITDLIAGGIGRRAVDMLNEGQVNVFAGVSKTDPMELLNDFINGTLTASNETCNHNHDHHGHHHGHHHEHGGNCNHH